MFNLRVSFVLTCIAVASLSPDFLSAAGTVSYNRDVRPILSESCFACHGPDANKRAADLRLDQKENAVEKKAIVPSQVSESNLIRRILSSDPDELMPPPSSHKVLSPKQKEVLKTWIAEGAEYQGHWAFIPPTSPELPQVRNGAWIRNSIDRFVLAEMERQGLMPAPEAELRSLVRRVCLDLTGLPPTAKEVDRVLADPSPDRYENYVDELLKRPEWGEHRGRYWLDYARYADTHGLHFDNYREMWSYREWVVKAFNNNMPFDQFTIEQLAGDLLPNPGLDQRIATGFNRCNITTNEGGTIAEENKVLYTRDRVETTGQVWLGLTVGCAVCHDHKFDPLTQKDFYQMAAFFNNTTQGALDGNIKDTPPIVNVPLDSDRKRYFELDELIDQKEQAKNLRKAAAKPAFDSYLKDIQEKDRMLWKPLLAGNTELHIPLTSNNSSFVDVVYQGQWNTLPLAKEPNFVAGHVGDFAWQIKDSFPSLSQAGDFDRDQAFSVSLWVKPASNNQTGSLVARMDEANDYRGWDVWMDNGAIGMHLIHKWQENAIKVVAKSKLRTDRFQHVVISYDGSSKAEGITIHVDGVELPKNQIAKNLRDSIKTTVPLTLGRRSQGNAATDVALQDLRIYKKKLSLDEIRDLSESQRIKYLFCKAVRTQAELDEFYEWYISHQDTFYVQLQSESKKLLDEKNQIKLRGTVAHIMHEAKEEPKAYVLIRGEYDKRSTEVKPDTPTVLPRMRPEWPKNRLGFAQWLVDREHPLTARVTVNRFWQEVFGTGLVGSSGDFGATGQMPTQPELLDHLATTFRNEGWNVKALFRSIVTSATYRQSASVPPEKIAADPANRYLSRGPRFRMDAEMIRDYALATSGLLVRKLGGPSVKPYQPSGVWEAVAMPESNTKKYVADKGEGLYRRSVYTFLKRAAPPPNMDAFNATSREVCTIRRERTNTPLQALVTLNDVQFIEAARVFASKVLLDSKLGNEPTARIQSMANSLLARKFRADELGIVASSLNELMEFYKQNPEMAKQLIHEGDSKPDATLEACELAAWTMLANELMNLDEVLTK